MQGTMLTNSDDILYPFLQQGNKETANSTEIK